MKTSILLFTTVSLLSSPIFAQYYEHTGKVSTLTFSYNPINTIHEKKSPLSINNFSTSIELSRMLKPGLFPTIGYTYQRSYNTNENRFRTAPTTSTPFNDAHQLNVSFEIRKQLFSKSERIKSIGKCILSRTGILIAPEYNYLYSQQVRNTSIGEFALKAGIYFYTTTNKVNLSKNTIYSIYYRHGFTPILSTPNDNGSQNYYRDEIGIRVTILFRQMYRFGW